MSSAEFSPRQTNTENHISIRGGMDGFIWQEQTGMDGEAKKVTLVGNTHNVANDQVVIVSQAEMQHIRRENAAAAIRTEAFGLVHDALNDFGPEQEEPFDGLTLSISALSRVLENNHQPEWTRPAVNSERAVA